MIAAKLNYYDATKLLLQEAQIADASGKTALMYAAMNGNLGVLDLLIDEERKIVDEDGRTALMHAVTHSQVKCV